MGALIMMPPVPEAKDARQIEQWPIARLKPYSRNARTHSTEQIAQIAASIQEFGFTNPILVAGDDGILAGHGRLAAAKDLGLQEVPVVVLDHLTPAQKRAYVLADNKLALNAGWNLDLLTTELDDLRSDDFDLSLLGWSADDLSGLLAPDPDFAPGTEDDQGQLDQTLPKEIDCRCPECGHEFIQQV
jgi:ParB-like chromosome segregation protein Spo0J